MENGDLGITFETCPTSNQSTAEENKSENKVDDENVDVEKNSQSTQTFEDREAKILLSEVAKDATTWVKEDLIGLIFDSVDEAEAFYKAYSTKIGFGVRRSNVLHDKESGTVILRRWVCSRQGERASKYILRTDRKREPRALTRCSCKAVFAIRYQKAKGIYRVTTFIPEHNHTVASSKHIHFFRSNREVGGHSVEIRTMKSAGIKTCQIMDYMVTTMGGFEHVGFTSKDIYNFVAADHERSRTMDSDAEATIAYLTAQVENDPGLYVRYGVDDDNKLNRLFWADSRSRLDYTHFGDVLVIDSTYRTNTFRLPLVELVGINNHYTTVVFGCALISEETIDAYTWVFRTFMHSMGEKQPVSILTDGDKAILNSINAVMPLARHRLCAWHLMRNARAVSPDDGFLQDFRKFVLHEYSEEEFESRWRLLVTKYKLNNNSWMKEMYEKKERWAGTFFKGVFFAGMTTSSICESMHAYMNRFLSGDLSLYKFVQQFHRGVNRLRQTELQHDFLNDQSEPVLITHLASVEKSAAEFYSRNVFKKVRLEIQEEIKFGPRSVTKVNNLMHFVIMQYNDDSDREIHVTSSGAGESLSCTCGMFESKWWPCRHIFCAMKATGMKTIPKVMLKRRWSKQTTLDMEKDYNISQVKSNAKTVTRSCKEDVPPEQTVIRDPATVRTKGSSQPNTDGTKRRKRHCGKCRKTGHNRSTCPNNKDEVGGITNEIQIPYTQDAQIDEDEDILRL